MLPERHETVPGWRTRGRWMRLRRVGLGRS